MDNELAFANRFSIPTTVSLDHYEYVKKRVSLLPYSFSKQYALLPVAEIEGKLWVAVSNPFILEPLEEIRLLLGKPVEAIYCPKEILDEAIERCYHHKNGEMERLISLKEGGEKRDRGESSEEYDLLEQTSSNPVVRLLNLIIMEAVRQEASDIHFEPRDGGLQVRFRIDGILQKRFEPPLDLQSPIITRIKVMSRLDIAEHRLPQDGRIKLHVKDREIDFRVSTIPTVYGERIVLRILDKGNLLLGLPKLGMEETILEEFQKLLRYPEGIILVTGPTGSGKTTTLYSALMEINAAEMNVMTIEDPVEYKLNCIAQIGVNPKINLVFSSGLRHILRQDPDVIMVGEVRDAETAEIAIQAALTGHLVFSTLHTNDAPSAIPRLVDMGIEPYLLSSSIIGVLAQRLVRKICPQCKTSYIPSRKELQDLNMSDYSGPLFRGNGCESCFMTGYKGRHGIFELMTLTPSLKGQILKNVDAGELRKVAYRNKIDLKQSGGKLVREGITNSSEVLRVVRMQEETSGDVSI